MTTAVLSIAVFGLTFLGMAVGALLGRGPLRGSCGGNSVLQQCGLCRRGPGIDADTDHTMGAEETP